MYVGVYIPQVFLMTLAFFLYIKRYDTERK